MMTLTLWQWTLLLAGGLMIGLSKTGIPGLGILFVALFANVLPTKEASGVVLPLLIVGDIVAVSSYRRHTVWRHLWGLFPWTGAGVVLGWLAMGRLDDRQARVLIGAIVLAMFALHLWRRRRGAAVEKKLETAAAPLWFMAAVGLLAGFTTLVANAAGPLMVLYLLAARLPKMEFMGTGAVFFMLLNLFKVPFMANLGLVDAASLHLNLWLAPMVLLGAFGGRWLLHRINQRWFENIALALTLLAGLKLLL